MSKVVIVGNSGSGKSWLGQRLAQCFRVPCVGLDEVFWEPGGYCVKRAEVEVEDRLREVQSMSAWVVEGVFGHLAERVTPHADLLVFLDLPWTECCANLMQRGSESSRQLDAASAEANFQRLLQWAANYETRSGKASRSYHEHLYESCAAEKYRLRSRGEIDRLWQRFSAGCAPRATFASNFAG